MTHYGDGVGRVAELQDEFEDERMGEDVEIDAEALGIAHYQITAEVGGFGTTEYHCERCGMKTSSVRDLQTAPCEPEDESADELVTDGGTVEVVGDGSRHHTMTDRDAASDGHVRVPIDRNQYLCNGAMEIDLDRERASYQNGPSAREKLSFCIQQLEDAETFAAPIGWQTGLVDGLSVEEVIGALLHAYDELDRHEEGSG